MTIQMIKTLVATEGYNINGFKHFSELAMEYFPALLSASAASKKMRVKILANKSLSVQLALANYNCHTKDVSPEMQLILYRHWGPPKIHLPTTADSVDKNKKNGEIK